MTQGKATPIFACPFCLCTNGVISYLHWVRVYDRPEQQGKIPIGSLIEAQCRRSKCRYREVWLPDDLKRAGLV